MSIYRRVFAYYRPFLGQTYLAIGLTIVSIGLGLLRPWPFAYIVGNVLPAAGQQVHELEVAGFSLAGWSLPAVVLLMCGLIISFHLLSGVLSLFTGVMFLRVGLDALLRLRTQLYAYLHSLPLKYHDERRSADSSFRVA
jgi:ATP-binding cassette subfamily B protein/subfamily B ATP-binding cassette protein MsbA